jgi:co-chaperonin GroES (HSP10)
MFAVSAHSRVRIAPAVIPRARARVVTRAGAAFEVPSAYKTVTPCGAGVLIKVAAAETVTKGGIVLTESAQRKPTSGASTRSIDARALEDGRRDRATRAGDKGRHPNLEGLTAGRAARRARREWIDARTRATRED